MKKIIKLIIAIIVVLLLCVGGFTYYNSTRQTSTQAKPNVNSTNTTVDKTKNSTNDTKDKKDTDSKKAIETTQTTTSKPLTNNSTTNNNNASNRVQPTPVSTNNNYKNTSANISSNTNSTTNTSNTNSNNNSAELASLRTQCTNAFTSIQNQVNQINNQPNSDSYQITAQQNHIYNLWNNQLNYMYQRLEAILPHSTFESLNNSEVSWINYKINESNKFANAGGKGTGGTMRYYYKDAQLTKERCYYLYNNYIK